MHNRIRVIMTKEGMRRLAPRGCESLPLTYGYMISCNKESVYVLEDHKKSIVKYSRNLWKPYHDEETY